MVRNPQGEKLDEAEARDAPAMRNFAAGPRKDLPAVRARRTESWSNGPVERFVHKVKLVKRQGYGRAGFELLRAGMMAARRPLGERFGRERAASPGSRQNR